MNGLSVNRRRLGVILLLAFVAVTLVSASLLMANPDDGRINIVAHFGGDAIYCVTASGYPTGDLASADGGFRVLDIDGQLLWSIPADVITAAIADASLMSNGVRIADGFGTYGPATLYVAVVEDTPIFTYVGTDEYGKQNQLEFRNCEPVGEREKPEGQAGGVTLCTVDELDDIIERDDDFGLYSCMVSASCDPFGGESGIECLCDAYPDSRFCVEDDKKPDLD